MAWIGYGSLPQGEDPGSIVFLDPATDMVAARAVLAWPDVTGNLASLGLPKVVRLPQRDLAKALESFLHSLGTAVNTDPIDTAMDHLLYLAQAEAASDLHLRRQLPPGTSDEVVKRVRNALADWEHQEPWGRVPQDLQLIAADETPQLLAIAMGEDAPHGVMVIREGNPDIGITLAYRTGRAFGVEGEFPYLTNYDDQAITLSDEVEMLLTGVRVVLQFAGLRRYERADPKLKLDVSVAEGVHRTLYIQSSQTKR
ncbi:MAG: hypothetical protein ACYCW6_01735 [Candidatus Xenobia bacterium]